METLDATTEPNRDSRKDIILTSPWSVQQLLKVEQFSGVGWEPASGTGNISKCFTPPLMSSDVSTEDWVYGEKGVDFLKTNREVDFIVTNPPFSSALEFAIHSLECATKVAFLLRVQFLDSLKRRRFFDTSPPMRVHIFSKKSGLCYYHSSHPNYSDKPVGGLQTLAWFVWEKGFSGKPTLDWLP